MDFFGPFEILALFTLFACSFASFALGGRSVFDSNTEGDWYDNLVYSARKSKPSIIALNLIIAFGLIALALSGWGALVCPIDYLDISNSGEAQELISVWDVRRKFWPFVTVLSMHLVTLALIPLWIRFAYDWQRLDMTFTISFFMFILAVLQTVFGYIFYWLVGLGYTFYLATIIYLSIHSAILFQYNSTTQKSRKKKSNTLLEEDY
jgi:hypothetical protein